MEFEKIAYVLVLVLIAPFLRGLARDILKKYGEAFLGREVSEEEEDDLLKRMEKYIRGLFK